MLNLNCLLNKPLKILSDTVLRRFFQLLLYPNLILNLLTSIVPSFDQRWVFVVCLTGCFCYKNFEMTKAFMAGVMILINQFRARWSWSVGILEPWLSVSSASEVPASSILRYSFPSMFRPRLWEISSGVVAVGVFAAEARRELRAHQVQVSAEAYCFGKSSHLEP